MGRFGINVVTAGFLIGVVAGCGGGMQTHTTILGQISWAQEARGPAPPPALASQAKQIARRSRLVQRLTGAGATVTDTFVWLGTVRHPRVIELAYALPHFRRVDAAVPFAEIPPDAPSTGDCKRPYAPGWQRLRARQVTVLFVGVDVSLGRVAAIDTNAKEEVVSSMSGRPYPVCREKT